MYARTASYPKRPASFAYSRDNNFTCYKNHTKITGCCKLCLILVCVSFKF